MSFGKKRDEREFDGFGFAFDDALDSFLEKFDFFARVKILRQRLNCGFSFFDYPISHFNFCG
jgi:hypothetical protein